jgi:NADH:ubiquinone oxidoreductase subunit 3 (subunit A)
MLPIDLFITLFLLFHNCCSINIFLLYVTIIVAPKIPSKDKLDKFECDLQPFLIQEARLMFNII